MSKDLFNTPATGFALSHARPLRVRREDCSNYLQLCQGRSRDLGWAGSFVLDGVQFNCGRGNIYCGPECAGQPMPVQLQLAVVHLREFARAFMGDRAPREKPLLGAAGQGF